MTARKTASNTVMIVRGSEVVARFGYGSDTDEGPVNPAGKAKAFLMGILADKEHDLHQDLLDGKLERLNAHVETVEVATAPTVR